MSKLKRVQKYIGKVNECSFCFQDLAEELYGWLRWIEAIYTLLDSKFKQTNKQTKEKAKRNQPKYLNVSKRLVFS